MHGVHQVASIELSSFSEVLQIEVHTFLSETVLNSYQL